MDTIFPGPTTIHLEGHQMRARAFLLGNEGGMVLHLPVELNVQARTILPSKWFGVSEFGRKYLEVSRIWFERAGRRTLLSRENQVGFDQDLIEAVRIFEVDGASVRQRYFVPNRLAGLVMTLESDRPATFVVEPQFDMRYYQSFNTEFGGYAAHIVNGPAGPSLEVENEIQGPAQDGRPGKPWKFHATVRTVGGTGSVQLLPAEHRLVQRTYLKDEHREKLIHKAYAETHELSPDEAPIWDSYTNTVYVPAQITADSPATFIYSFDENAERAQRLAARIESEGTQLFRKSEASATHFLEGALFRTGDAEIDLAYNQTMVRFNSALVARDVIVWFNDGGQRNSLDGIRRALTQHATVSGNGDRETLTAIFAGDKYFLDAWKRDENISLEALLLMANDYETVRIILDDTWQYQDQRTGRLPHIIRPVEPLVYFSSDGTLWALQRLWQYTQVSGDASLLDEKYPMVEHFFKASLPFVRRGLLPSGGIIRRSYLWETWEDTAFTPRDGYPVEIELLWLTVLRDYLSTIQARDSELAARLEETLEQGRSTFERFLLDGYVADSLDYDFIPRELLTPNGYLAFAIGYPLPEALGREMVLTARRQLAGSVGVKSLAPRDWPKVFSEEFLNDPANIHDGNMASVGIYNYHRGIEWLWLNPFMVAGELLYGDADHAYNLYVRGQVRSVLEKSGVGGLDELSDFHGPLGADFQAWSMTGFTASLRQFVGVSIDAIEKRVRIQPRLPSSWPELLSRHRVEKCIFDVEVRRLEDGGRLTVVDSHDHVPGGYTIEIALMDPHRDRVTINGRDVSGRRIDRRDAPEGAGIWIETAFER
jgi:glycogen debranching enzyme